MMKQCVFLGGLILLFVLLSQTLVAHPDPKDSIYSIVDEIPEFPGGEIELQRFMSVNFKYPKEVDDIHGTIYIRFAIMQDGHVDSVHVLRSIYSQWDEEAVRVVKLMPNWKPGKINGKPVAVWYNLPFRICLSE